jgi:histidinol-phosphate aminotransferase
MAFDLHKITRPNIVKLVAYSSARDEFSGAAKVFLDANENSLGSPLMKWYNRYPDPHQKAIKQKLAIVKSIAPEHIFLGNGSDECIDLLFRSFCEPGKDNVIICPPTYGMYEVSANINDVAIKKVPLLENFQLDLIHMENAMLNGFLVRIRVTVVPLHQRRTKTVFIGIQKHFGSTTEFISCR